MLWLYSNRLGLNADTVMSFGYGMAILFFLSCFYVLGSLDLFGGLAAGLFLISYAVMFGLERGNVDLLMFVLLALALALRRFIPLAALVIALAGILKVHPLFAYLALMMPPWKKTLPSIGLGLLIFAGGIAVHFHDFLAAMRAAPNMRSGILSYGITSLGLVVMERFQRPDLYLSVLICSTMLFIITAGMGAWLRPTLDPTVVNERELFAFRIGAGIYLGSFLLGTNHDYRAIFLLFCFPMLFQLLKRGIALGWVRTTLFLILIYVNWLSISGEATWLPYLLNQATAWALVVCLAALSVATLPEELQWPRRIRISNPSHRRPENPFPKAGH